MAVETRMFVWFGVYINVCESVGYHDEGMSDAVAHEMREFRAEIEILNTVGDDFPLESLIIEQIAIDRLFFSRAEPLRVYNRGRMSHLAHNDRVGTLYSMRGDLLYDVLSTFAEVSLPKLTIANPKNDDEPFNSMLLVPSFPVHIYNESESPLYFTDSLYPLSVPFKKCLFIFGLEEEHELFYPLLEDTTYGFVMHFYTCNVFLTRLILTNSGLPIA